MPGFAPVSADLSGVIDAIGQFFEHLAAVEWIPLLLGLALYGLALTARSRGSYNVLKAAYPDEKFRFLPVWGAYVAAYGANAVFPARPGDIVRLFLLKRTVPELALPDAVRELPGREHLRLGGGDPRADLRLHPGRVPEAAGLLQARRLRPVVLRRPPAVHAVRADGAGDPRADRRRLLSARVKAFWARVRQGWTILRDRRRYFREVVSYQALAWALRFGCFWFLLDAFSIGGGVRNVLLVFGVTAVSSMVPLTPGGAGVQQALFVKVFATSATAATVASYSVGQQIAIAAFSFGLGLVALITVFEMRSFRQVIRLGKAERAAAQSPS